MKTKRNLKRILSVILTVLMIMSTLVVGVVSTSAATIPAGTTLYIDATNFTGGKTDTATGVYVSVSADSNKDYRGDKGNTNGVGYNNGGNSFYIPDNDTWCTTEKIVDSIYKVTITSESTVGKISVWSRNMDGNNDVWQVNCSLNNTYDGTNNMLVIDSGCTEHTSQQSYCYSGHWETYGSGGSTSTAKYYYHKSTDTNGSLMTVSDDGNYEYIKMNAGSIEFKIATTASGWDYGSTCIDSKFNGTDIEVTSESTYGNCKIDYTSGDYYILAYYPNTTVNTTSNIKICASTFLPDNSSGGSTGKTWYVTGRFGIKKTDGTEVYTGDTWNTASDKLPMSESGTTGVYKLDTGYTISELSNHTGTTAWYFKFYDKTTVYEADSKTDLSSSTYTDIDLTGSEANKQYHTIAASNDINKSYHFNDTADTSTGTVTLYLNTTGTTPVFYFTVTTPTTPGTYTVKSDTIINGKVAVTNSDTTRTADTANEGDTITVTPTPYGNYFSLNTLTYSYDTKDAAGTKTTVTTDITSTKSFTMPAANVKVKATFTLDKAAYIATQGDGLWIDVAPDKTDTMSTLIKWNNYTGTDHATASAYTFYVPSGVDLTNAHIYNGFGEAVTLYNVSIPADGTAGVNLTAGTTYNTAKGDVKVMQGSTSSMFLYTSDGKGNDYDLPTSTSDSRVEALKKDSIKAAGGDCTTMTNGTATGAMALTQVKGRGNSSWEASKVIFGKYAFNMKLDSATALLGLPKSKSFCLLANNMDQSMLRNALTYDLAYKIGLYDSPEFKFIDIYDNGEYMGAYMITEKVDVADKNKLIKGNCLDDIHEDIATANNTTVIENRLVYDTTTKANKTFETAYGTVHYNCAKVADDLTPYANDYANATFLLEFEIASRYYDEVSWFQTPEGQYVVVKSPEFATEEELKFIATKYVEMENAVYSTNNDTSVTTLASYMDVDSFAKMYLIQELSANLDSAATSYYITYNVTDGHFVASPVWDYDWAYAQHTAKTKEGMVNGNSENLFTGDVSKDVTDWFARDKKIGDNQEPMWNIQAQLANNSNFQSVIKKVWNGSGNSDGFYSILQTYYSDATNGQLYKWEKEITDSMAMNEARWNTYSTLTGSTCQTWGERDTTNGTGKLSDAVTFLADTWTKTRANWLNTEINNYTAYTQIATPTLTVTDAGGNVVESAFAVNTKLTLKAATTESYVTYNFYDGATLLGSNTTGTLEITPDTLGEHQYKVVTAYGSDTQNSNIVTANAVQGKETGAAITNMTLYFKGTNLTYLNPYLEIKDSEGNVVMEKTPLTRATEHFGTHFEGSYRFYMYTVNIASLTVGKNYTFTFTTNGSSMSATVVPDLTADWFYTGADIYFAVDNLHTGKEAVDITNNTTARTTCRNSVHMITNTGTTTRAAVKASLAGISSDDTVYFLGDMDKNGTLDIKDAAAVQLKLAQLADTEAGDSILGDFNIDGEFNIKDAAAIQLSLAKLY